MNSSRRFLQVDLLNGSILKSIILFSIPIFISYIFQQLYNAADIYIIGKYLNENSLISIGACTSIYELLVGFGVGFGNGLSIVAAKAFGADNQDKLKRITAASLIVTGIVTLFVMIISRFFLKSLMIVLKTPADNLEEAYSYISVIVLYCGVLFAYNLFAGMLRAIGNSVIPLIFLIVSSVLNIILDVVFIKYFEMGIAGAAYATVVAQLISALLSLIYIYYGARILIPAWNHFAAKARIYKELFIQGLSMALMGSIVHSGTVILQRAINILDPFVIAGHMCARKIFTLTNIPIIALGLASSTFVSQNLGAGKIDRIKKGVHYAILITTIWTVILFLPAWFGIQSLVRFISSSDNEIINSYASRYILFTIPFYLILGALIIIRNSLQGLGQKLLPLISSFIELIGKIVFTIYIIPALGQTGVILCEPLIWCVMTAQLLLVYYRLPIFKKNQIPEIEA